VIRANLATRPFYNERAVHLALVALAVLVVAATAFNVMRVVRLSRSDTRLATQASRDEATARDLRASAARLRASVDPKSLEAASVQAREANQLIDRRTFSWTELFNRFETTLPDDVRITSVRPVLDSRRGNVLTITVVAKNVEDVNQFMKNLESTGAFADLLPKQERVDEQGLLVAALETVYTPKSPPARESSQ
jgi:type IV pilus assembly protein PilN